jgi:hypothetical protein
MEKTALKKFSLKVLIPFYDIQCDGIKRLRNQEFECSEERGKELLNYNHKIPYSIPGAINRIVELIEIK